jgi:hypothetical protein
VQSRQSFCIGCAWRTTDWRSRTRQAHDGARAGTDSVDRNPGDSVSGVQQSSSQTPLQNTIQDSGIAEALHRSVSLPSPSSLSGLSPMTATQPVHSGTDPTVLPSHFSSQSPFNFIPFDTADPTFTITPDLSHFDFAAAMNDEGAFLAGERVRVGRASGFFLGAAIARWTDCRAASEIFSQAHVMTNENSIETSAFSGRMSCKYQNHPSEVSRASKASCLKHSTYQYHSRLPSSAKGLPGRVVQPSCASGSVEPGLESE